MQTWLPFWLILLEVHRISFTTPILSVLAFLLLKHVHELMQTLKWFMGIVFTLSYFSMCVSFPDRAVEGYHLVARSL